MNRRQIKRFLGELPYTAELYWQLVQRHKPWQAHFNLDFLERVLPDAVRQAEYHARLATGGKKVFIFATLHYWIEFSALLGVLLAGKGHQVTFAFLPFDNWDKPIGKFDLRRQNLYARQVLGAANRIMRVQSILDVRPFSKVLPPALMHEVENVSIFDTQYTLQVEAIAQEDALYKLRYKRNREAAQNARAWLAAHKPDIAIIPNGTIQEMGVVYQVARHLQIPTVTFEFSDQREHIWMAQDSEIMRHNTDALWEVRGNKPLGEEQILRLQGLFSAREDAKTWKNFARKWQETPTEGTAAIQKKIGLDRKPVVLLATNVLGDSLTLGRQTFSETMAEWIEQTVSFFLDREDVQLIVRIHPGEMLTHGTSMTDVINAKFEYLPDHIHIIKPDEKINTYDILELTDLGLVYTTTVGLEMAMRGIPVMVAGKTHYRNRGFTHDPDSWKTYFEILGALLADLESARLTQEQVELAWRYSYLFFFEFPKPFPWHLLDLKEDYEARSMKFVLSEEGSERYDDTLAYLTGKLLEW